MQDQRTGRLSVLDAPVPAARPGHVVVRTEASAVSVGTERQTVDFARRTLLGKALARPDLLRQVIAKARAEGVAPAWRAARGRLDGVVALGYSSAGTVVAVGAGVDGFAVGDRVACSGADRAGHAEVVSVPQGLVAPLPAGLDPESGAFAAVGAIALHAVDRAEVRETDPVLVVGLGLLGQIAVQILRARGCRVFGVDPDGARLALARHHGAVEGATGGDPLLVAERVRAWAGGGVRAALIFAATPSDAPLHLAAEACGERGRVVAAGLVGLSVPRKPFFDKELELVVPRAWGPGAHPGSAPRAGEPDAAENLRRTLALVAKGDVRFERIVTHRFGFDEVERAYALILEGREPFLGVALRYGPAPASVPSPTQARASGIRVGVVGAGRFARGTILPLLAAERRLTLASLATSRSVEAADAAKRFGFAKAESDAARVIGDPDLDAVVVLTRHATHADLVARALEAGKKVFVEKPLAIDDAGLRRVEAAWHAAEGPFVMVGFNRRFAPATRFLLEQFGPAPGPLAVDVVVNAGASAPGSWTTDPEEGGDRIVGEVCHFVDLVQAITGEAPSDVAARATGASKEDVHVLLSFPGGHTASILYSARGARGHMRERVEVHGAGSVGVIEDFRRATFTGPRGRSVHRRWSADRGHRAEINEFAARLADAAPAPVPFASYVATTRATFAIQEAVRTGATVRLGGSG